MGEIVRAFGWKGHGKGSLEEEWDGELFAVLISVLAGEGETWQIYAIKFKDLNSSRNNLPIIFV